MRSTMSTTPSSSPRRAAHRPPLHRCQGPQDRHLHRPFCA
jgi:hypothetical protein